MKIHPLKYLMIIPLFLFQGCQTEDDDTITTIPQFENYLAGEIDFQNIPAMSILIFNQDEVILERYLGKSHLEDDIALQANHLFLLASISKVVTATALLQLYEDQLFSLDDRINDFLPFSVDVPNHSQDITFRMLLTHTSAIADGRALNSQYYYGEDSPIKLSFFLENYLVAGGEFYDPSDNFYDFAPGTDHEYSNIGSALIALLVEEISGLNFNEYCKNNIFIPLDMRSTFWRLDEINQPIVQPYHFINGQFNEIPHYTFTDYPNGGLRSTSRDLHQLLIALMNGGTSNNHQLLNASTVEEMLTPQIPNLKSTMGLHLFRLNSANELWGHDGGEQGVSTIMAFNPNTKVGAIILTNSGSSNLYQILIEAYQFGLKQ